jgi:hypothetical protein
MKGTFMLFILLWLVACKKPADRACLKKSGNYTSFTISLNEFNRLHLKEHLRYVLVPDTVSKVIVKGGSNLIGFIEANQDGSLLTLSNKNRCHFLRNYEYPEVEIHYSTLVNILYEGTETLTNSDTLKTNYLVLTLKDGAGSVDLCIDAIDVKLDNTHGWGKALLRGKTDFCSVNLMGDGSFDGRELSVSTRFNMISASSLDQYLSAPNIPLYAQIKGVGNVYYFGTPSNIYFSRYGSGNLIPQ